MSKEYKADTPECIMHMFDILVYYVQLHDAECNTSDLRQT